MKGFSVPLTINCARPDHRCLHRERHGRDQDTAGIQHNEIDKRVVMNESLIRVLVQELDSLNPGLMSTR